MSERTTGLYKLVTLPRFYAAFQKMLGADRSRERVSELYFPNLTGQDVLEVGCGPASGVPYMETCQSYLGLDWNRTHIAAAQALYPDPKYVFDIADVGDPEALSGRMFDRVFMFGLLHHLDDDAALSLLRSIGRILRPGGELLAGEPIYHLGQHPIARFMKNRDSGQNIRDEASYMRLVQSCFENVTFNLHKDLLRIPYSHCMLQCSKPTS